jgi:chromate transport protein ChrA
MKYLKIIFPYIIQIILLFFAMLIFVEKDVYKSFRFCLLYLVILLIVKVITKIIKFSNSKNNTN